MAAQREQRKVVTVLFCDLAGSTALGESVDPERLRALLAAYFERMKGIVERHGGSVEKFIGDAVMAVFGVPAVHEDDALRAVRAAAEMRDALPELGLEGRIGVMTGEVVTGTDERLATGDAVNVAARLEQAASPGDVLVGEPTLDLVQTAVDVEPIEPLVLKGKTDPVPAYRLLHVHDAPGRSHRRRFVGRREELGALLAARDRAQTGERCELITIVGDVGVGKSRLVAEAVGTMCARVIHARCPPYGEGITYWPVVEVLKQLDVLPPEETAMSAIRSLLGESDSATSAEEIAWAFRKALERAAEGSLLVVVFDDIQWGEPTFLDLVEHVALLSSGRPLLLVCVARPELTELRPTWPVSLRLGPLPDEDVVELIAERVLPDLRDKIARAAGGNALFVEEMVAVSEDAADVVVPPTLRAVIAARLDRLGPSERSILERAAIEGETFHRGAVQALAPEQRQVTPLLAALVRQELIAPDRPQLAGEDGFRFRHLLIRDAAYDALPKGERAELHVRFAGWLEQHGKELVELDEVLGYHLERACAYRVELGLDEDVGLAAGARRRLAAGGRRAGARKDFGAAASLLERAVALLPANVVDVALELELARALYESGRGADAVTRSESLIERSRTQGNRVGELAGKLHAGYVLQDLEPEGAAERLDALIAEALPELQAAGDDDALYTAHFTRGMVAFSRAQGDAALEAWELAARHARAARIPDELVGWRALARLYGATPVTEVLAWLDENEPLHGRDDWLRASRGVALAMLGRFEEGRGILAATRIELAERGGGVQLAVLTAMESALIERLAGDPATAAVLGAEGCKLLEELEALSFLSTAAAYLAGSLYELGRLDEAEAWAERAAEAGDSDDLFTQPLWRLARAKIAARRGVRTDAERLVREALSLTESTEDLSGLGDAYADLAEVLLLAERADEAGAALERALECYERKENLASAERTRGRLEELAASA